MHYFLAFFVCFLHNRITPVFPNTYFVQYLLSQFSALSILCHTLWFYSRIVCTFIQTLLSKVTLKVWIFTLHWSIVEALFLTKLVISQFPDQRYWQVWLGIPLVGKFCTDLTQHGLLSGEPHDSGSFVLVSFLGLFVYLCVFCILGLARLKWTVALGCRQKPDTLCRQHSDEYQSQPFPHQCEFTSALTGSNKRQQGLNALMNWMGGNGCSRFTTGNGNEIFIPPHQDNYLRELWVHLWHVLQPIVKLPRQWSFTQKREVF